MNIDIIGGGIGGLTTAIALDQKGIDYRIFEQTKTMKPVGAGIILANNAMQVYNNLGIKYKIEQKGNPISFLKITNLNFKPLSMVDLRYFEAKYGVKNIVIHRGDLQQILLSEIKAENLYLDHHLKAIKSKNKSFELEFENGNRLSSDIIIGADGLKSKVRDLIFKDGKIRNSHQICWRGIAEYQLPKKFLNEANEIWGKGDRFGFVQLDTHRVYWYALKSIDSKTSYTTDTIEVLFKDYPSMIQELLALTPKTAIHCDIIQDLKPIHNWYRGNICLLGDAAHATTPNLGQGACQAIEDAYMLSNCLDDYKCITTAFSEYEHKRITKAHQVVKMSWTIGKMAHWKNPIAILLRNFFMQKIPKSLNRKQSERIFEL